MLHYVRSSVLKMYKSLFITIDDDLHSGNYCFNSVISSIEILSEPVQIGYIVILLL